MEIKTTSAAAMDPGILKHPDETTYMYRVYITLPPARAAQAPRLSM